MKITDGKKTVEIKMQHWNGSGYDPDFSEEFFEAGGLEYDEEADAYKVEDVDYCIDQATDCKNCTGDFCNNDPSVADFELFVTEL